MPDNTKMLPPQHRSLQVRGNTWNADDRTVEVIFSTGARVQRFNWDSYQDVEEELSLEPGAVRLERLNAGAPVLNIWQPVANA
ncbi:MAG: hypothetical protein WCZ66_10615 [Sphingomonadaceae bacterium]